MLSYSHTLPDLYPELDERFLFFDIETTGLQADASSLYLLGCLFRSSSQALTLLQWFSDDYLSEPQILKAFSETARKHPIPVHYNGSSFDLPYLRKKYQKYHMEFPFGEDNGIDLCRHARILKKHFGFQDCCLKTMEALAGIQRKDPFDGRELIEHYSRYIRGRYLYHRMPEKQRELSSYLPALLLHNQEDVENLPRLFALALLTGSLPEDCIQIEAVSACSIPEKEVPSPHMEPFLENSVISAGSWKKGTPSILISVRIPRFMEFSLKAPFLTGQALLSCTLDSRKEYSRLAISLPSKEGEFKYFFENYQDYYYLPYEDMAIHKSVGSFVDKNFRTKATRENCYIKKKGFFLPSLFPSSPAVLYENFKEKQGFIEINDSLLTDTCFWKQYVNSLFKHIFGKK